MGLTIDWGARLIKVTSPTVSVDAQTLHDFIEDRMASSEGALYTDIIQPEGKIEDPNQPGVFSQIIMVFHSPWQVQFWGGSEYTRIYGGKLVGGLNDQVVKATGTAGDVTVLENPVDGLTVATVDTRSVLGLAGENVKWSNLTHDANGKLTGATITLYASSDLLVAIKSWQMTSSYDQSGKITDYQMVAV